MKQVVCILGLRKRKQKHLAPEISKSKKTEAEAGLEEVANKEAEKSGGTEKEEPDGDGKSDKTKEESLPKEKGITLKGIGEIESLREEAQPAVQNVCNKVQRSSD